MSDKYRHFPIRTRGSEACYGNMGIRHAVCVGALRFAARRVYATVRNATVRCTAHRAMIFYLSWTPFRLAELFSGRQVCFISSRNE
jgi:hypothetical protein